MWDRHWNTLEGIKVLLCAFSAAQILDAIRFFSRYFGDFAMSPLTKRKAYKGSLHGDQLKLWLWKVRVNINRNDATKASEVILRNKPVKYMVELDPLGILPLQAFIQSSGVGILCVSLWHIRSISHCLLEVKMLNILLSSVCFRILCALVSTKIRGGSVWFWTNTKEKGGCSCSACEYRELHFSVSMLLAEKSFVLSYLYCLWRVFCCHILG